MKKLALLFILAACELVFGMELVQAQIELETWCHAQGASWQPDIHYCGVSGIATVSENEILAILGGDTLSNDGTIFVQGTIVINKDLYNHGFIENFGGIYNYGTIENASFLQNFEGFIENFGSIHNKYMISNEGSVVNHVGGTIDNDDRIGVSGTIDNAGTIENAGTFDIYSSGDVHNSGNMDNRGTIDNSGIIQNDGRIANYCFATYNGFPPGGNALVDIACLHVYFPLSCNRP